MALGDDVGREQKVEYPGQRQSYHVGIRATYAGHKKCSDSLNGVGPGLVHRLVCRNVSLEFGLIGDAHVHICADGVQYGFAVWQGEAESRDDLMRLAGEGCEHLKCIRCVLGFAHDVVAQDNDGVGSEHGRVGEMRGHIHGFQFGHAFDVLQGGFVRHGSRFFDGTRMYCEFQSEISQQLPSAWGTGGKDEWCVCPERTFLGCNHDV